MTQVVASFIKGKNLGRAIPTRRIQTPKKTMAKEPNLLNEHQEKLRITSAFMRSSIFHNILTQKQLCYVIYVQFIRAENPTNIVYKKAVNLTK